MAGDVEAFIERWQGHEGGQERANYALFLSELCDVLDLPRPDPADAAHETNDYVFERLVHRRDGGDAAGWGRIDLYKRGCFILEAKQSRWKGGKKAIAGQDDLFQAEKERARGRRGIDRNWDVLMLNARRQAEEYARALPPQHDWPPFVIVCDVGHAFEIYADFTGKGRNYSQFPDRRGYRVYLEDLRDESVRDRLRLIWTDPHKLDPSKESAEATRDVAKRLAAVSLLLEGRGFEPEEVAHFLMRCLFTMFAEDVKLLPEGCFTELLQRCVDDPSIFEPMVGHLWATMNSGGFAHAIAKQVKKFNGEFFKSTKVLALNKQEIGELLLASKRKWNDVEPAIFGTLLESALDKTERSRLGAHYTPRAYVERLVVPTIMEPLREDWLNTLRAVEKLREANDDKGAIAEVHRFHEQLCDTRVLDPACGTGNFLYVSMALMKRLEGEVLDALVELGGQEALAMEDRVIDPRQFLGLEVNPRAAAIAELVLWIGWLQLHYRQSKNDPAEPILRAFGNIQCRDAVLTWDSYPVTTVVDGEETYPNPRKPDWPMAEFIVGNPPFVAGTNFRREFGDAYAEAAWSIYKGIPGGADFVMYWWDRSASLLLAKGSVLRRFGLVTTNSITQEFSGRVVERHLRGDKPLSLVLAIPNHPWTKATQGAAAVRIAMTVGRAGRHDGRHLTVLSEGDLRSDTPHIEFEERGGTINPNLTIGADVTQAAILQSNAGLCHDGVKLHGKAFRISRKQAEAFGLGTNPALDSTIRPYLNGRDVNQKPRGFFVIDFFGLSDVEARQAYPELYQYLAQTVRPARASVAEKSSSKDVQTYARDWWLWGKPRPDMRSAIAGASRYIATVDTSKHRIFQFLPSATVCDDKVVITASDDPYHLAVVSSCVHVAWTLGQNSRLGQGDDPVYVKSRCFDPFPFPDPVPETLKEQMREAAEELDRTRKDVLDAHEDLTLTKLYNVLEKVRSIAAAERGTAPSTAVSAVPLPRDAGEDAPTEAPVLTDAEIDMRDRGRVLIIKDLHDTIDRLTFKAYGWPETLSDEEILERLVALNKARAAEEANGQVRWLRPEYQIPRFGTQTEKKQQIEATLTAPEDAGKPSFPREEARRAMVISAALARATGPLSAAEIAGQFRQGKRAEKEIALMLRAFARLGELSTTDGGRTFMLRRAA